MNNGTIGYEEFSRSKEEWKMNHCQKLWIIWLFKIFVMPKC